LPPARRDAEVLRSAGSRECGESAFAATDPTPVDISGGAAIDRLAPVAGYGNTRTNSVT